MTCPRCARPAAADDRFCGGCGAGLDRACRRCGRSLGPDIAYCTGCGMPMHNGGEPTGLPSPQSDRRRISVLFIDLVDFTPFVEHSDPEQVRLMQTDFFRTARRVIRQYGGVVEKYIGDAVMAIFGAPITTETDALRCVRAGLELQRVLGSDEQHQFRVGIATGEALVDVAAAHDGAQAIVAGDVVTTAARLETAAPPGGVLVCGPTHAATKASIRYTEHNPVWLRGRSAPTEVALAVASLRDRHPEDSNDDTRLVDREHESGLLVNALHRTIRDRVPQLVTVFGQAGIGKSRLVRELRRHAARLSDTPVRWRVGHCPPFGANVTYAALADIVKAHAGILDTDSTEVAVERLRHAVAELVDAPAPRARLVDALGPLVGAATATLGAEETESAWRRFLVALASKHPTVLVFEDLHWADPAMLHFVELLTASARDIPLLVLCTARPELSDRVASWTSATDSLSVSLGPLPDADIADLYAEMFGRAAFPAERLVRLVELADGNPLYAHEYVRMLIDSGSLRRAGDAWSWIGGDGVPVPDSVQTVIANRLDLLEPMDRAVLLAAAVVGMQFWPGAVAAALGVPTETAERSLRHLEQRRLVHAEPNSTMADEPEFRFRHVLVRDVCYQRLPRTERVARHVRTAEWLDTVSREADVAEVLAHHRWAAHEIARILDRSPAEHAPAARDALARAAHRAYALHAVDIAAGHVRRALSLYDDDETDGRHQLELLEAELEFVRDRDTFLAGDGMARLGTLADRLAAVDDRSGAARAWTLLGQAAWLSADRKSALDSLGRAIALFGPLPDSEPKATAYAELGRLHMMDYDHEPAEASAGTAADLAARLGLVEVRANAMITVATARFFSGAAGARHDLGDAVAFCRTHQLPSLRRAINNLAACVQEDGDLEQAFALFAEHRALTASDGHSLTYANPIEATMRAFYAGNWHATLDHAATVLDGPTGEWEIQIRLIRAWIRLLRDESAESSEEPDDVSAALSTAHASGFRRLRWAAFGHGALTRALAGRPDAAVDLLAELRADWLRARALASGEWLPAAAHAAALVL